MISTNLTFPTTITNPPGRSGVITLMRPEGDGINKVLICGESLGENEERDRLPLRPYAASGSLLERAFYELSHPRQEFLLTNMVWWRPEGNRLDGQWFEQAAVERCWEWNDALVERYEPKCVLAVGGFAFRHLTGMAGSGKGYGIQAMRGFLMEARRWGIPLVGTYHPSWIRRGSKDEDEATGAKTKAKGDGGMALFSVIKEDLKLAMRVAKNGALAKLPTSYTLGATLEHWERFYLDARENPHLPISYDFEDIASMSEESEEEFETRSGRSPTQFQASLRPGEAVVSPWFNELAPVVRRLMELPNPKLDWNGRGHDRPILRDMQVRLDRGDWHDVMDYWGHWQRDWPRGLQFAASFVCPEVGPWKHMSGEDGDELLYGAFDADMPQRIFAWLEKHTSAVRHPVSGVSVRDGYYGQVMRLSKVLGGLGVAQPGERIGMSERGIPVSEERRVEAGRLLDIEKMKLLEAIQPLVPEAWKNEKVYSQPHRVKEYDEQAGGAGELWVEDVDEETGVTSRFKFVKRREVVKRGASRKCNDCKGTGIDQSTAGECGGCKGEGKVWKGVVEEGEVWVKKFPWNPNSRNQVLDYIKKRRAEEIGKLIVDAKTNPRMGPSKDRDREESWRRWAEARALWKVPIKFRTVDEEDTGKKEILRLYAKVKDPVLRLGIDYKEVGKVKSTYIEGWKPAADGFVHPLFKNSPATGQGSSTGPNAQNTPKHNAKFFKIFRSIIEAKPGRVLITFDWKSFHALTLGFEGKDPTYMRMARLDIHSFFAGCGLLKLAEPGGMMSLSDTEMMTIFKTWKSDKSARWPGGEHGELITFKQTRDGKAKKAILGFGFALGGLKLHHENQETIHSPKEGQELVAALRKLFPAIVKFQEDCRETADRQGYLVSRYGYIRRFNHVFEKKPVLGGYQAKTGEKVRAGRNGMWWLLKPGEDSEACIAYLPANDAFGIKKEKMLELWEKGLDEKYGLCNEIHDELFFHCPEELEEECVRVVGGIMREASKVLFDEGVAPDGLWCDVSVSVGRNWSEMKELEG